jgi:hypothetical protein
MKKSTSLRVLCALLVLVVLSCAPIPAFAQRGGGGFHGGGGGFHGGGGHYGYAGGGQFYGGYHGGGYGWHGGYYGWRGGSWGYPRWGYGYGYGWGFSIGFNWAPYGFGYPYAYGYGPWWGGPYYYSPYYYPYSVPPAYPYSYPNPNNGSGSVSAPDSGLNSHNNSPGRYSNSPNPSSMVNNVLAPAWPAPNYRTQSTASTVVVKSMRQIPPARREVQNVIEALRAMPPGARQRQIDSGRYSSFSPEERELLNSLSQPAMALGNSPESVPRPPL